MWWSRIWILAEMLCLLQVRSAVGGDGRPTGTGRALIVSFDGLRWDYLDDDPELRNFQRLEAEGSRAPYMNNTFVTLTFSTHYSMATGLYEESHGVVGNYMYDPDTREYFSPGDTESRWWDGGEPFWTTATKHGKKAGAYFWPGADVAIGGVRPLRWLPYDLSTPFTERVDTVIAWMLDDDLDLGVLYFHEPDKTGHTYGPGSPEVKAKLREVDGILGHLLQRMAETNLSDTVNLLVVSDHGMTSVSRELTVSIPHLLDMSDIEAFVELGSVCHIFPKQGKLEDIYQGLKGKHQHMHVYKKEELPERWHYKHNRRIGPILTVMDEHWQCTENRSASWLDSKGTHGYDNNYMSMKPIFLAKGPDIKVNHRMPPFKSVDIYPLICELINVAPSPNNGTLKIVKSMLKHHSDSLSDVAGSHAPGSIGGHCYVLAIGAVMSIGQIAFV